MGSQTYTSGSGNFTLPSAYGALTVQLWGPSGGSGGGNGTDTGGNGTATTCSTLGMTANGGAGGGSSNTSTNGAGGAGGGASGGNLANNSGGTGGGGSHNSTGATLTTGNGAASPSGGGGAAAGVSITSTNSATGVTTNGTSGNSPGGGPSGGGYAIDVSGTHYNEAGAGAGGGAYCESVYTFGLTSGYPAAGSSLAWAVGAPGAGADAGGVTGTYGQVVFSWTDPPTPTVSSISPSAGPLAGGQSVTISGQNFTGATSVTIGGNAATSVSVVNDSTITCNTPSGSAGTASVLVTTPGGTNSANTLYDYYNAPTVSAVSPAAGPLGGGTHIAISGLYLDSVESVTVGGNLALIQSYVPLTCYTPAGSAGAASVLVTTPGGTNSANTFFTYDNVPTVSSISPSAGPIAGGQFVTISGQYFTGATSVTIGGNAATSVFVGNDSLITCYTPSGSAGTASVLVTTPGGTNSANTLYQYDNIPTVSSISPSTGPSAGGTFVTISGQYFTGATGVTIGGHAATSVSVSNDSTITCNTPSGNAGTASVLVTTPGGTNSANSLFAYGATGTWESTENKDALQAAGYPQLTGTWASTEYTDSFFARWHAFYATMGPVSGDPVGGPEVFQIVIGTWESTRAPGHINNFWRAGVYLPWKVRTSQRRPCWWSESDRKSIWFLDFDRNDGHLHSGRRHSWRHMGFN